MPRLTLTLPLATAAATLLPLVIAPTAAEAATDSVAPTLRITAPAYGGTTGVRVTLAGTARDNVALRRVTISLDGRPAVLASGLTSWRRTFTVSEAWHTATVRATDLAGRTTSRWVRFKASPSGRLMPTKTYKNWRLAMSDTFSTPVREGQFPGAAYGRRWITYDDHHPAGRGYYMPSKVLSVHDGMLDFRLHTENGRALVAAAMPLIPGKDQTYGRYSVRFKADAVPGYSGIFMLWPRSERWPDDGEIDFVEGHLDGQMNGYMHYARPEGGQQSIRNLGAWNRWHTATVAWMPGLVRFYLDGTLVATSTKLVPRTDMHWVLQTGVVSDGPMPDPSRTAHVYIDWVKQWSRV